MKNKSKVWLADQFSVISVKQVKVVSYKIGHKVNKNEDTCASQEGRMGAWLWNTKAFTHECLDLEDVLVIFKVESMRETCQSLVVLNCEHYFWTLSVPVLLE